MSLSDKDAKAPGFQAAEEAGTFFHEFCGAGGQLGQALINTLRESSWWPPAVSA